MFLTPRNSLRLLAGIAAALLLGTARTAPAQVTDATAWPAFISRHDIHWDKPPAGWLDCPFVGNGLVGCTIQGDAKADTLRWEIGREDVIDQRPGANVCFDRCRLPIGGFVLKPVGKITGGTTDLHLWDAQAQGTLTTTKGTIAWRTFTPRTQDVIVVELDTTGGENALHWSFDAAPSQSTRTKGAPADYKPNPAPTRGHEGAIEYVDQPLLAGGGYATAWQVTTPTPDKQIITIAEGYAHPATTYRQQALELVQSAVTAGPEALRGAHQKWWHDYYRISLVSVPDAKLERFYWVQMYKFASATRAGGPMLDLIGPWWDKTPWPAIWWNLNVQLTYAPVCTSNRMELMEPLMRTLDTNAANLEKNVPHGAPPDTIGIGRVSSYDLLGGVSNEYGDMPWTLQLYYLHCRFTADDARLRDKFFPLLKKCMNLYLWLLKPGPDGKLHMPKSTSPEYGEAPDTNYELAMIHWQCRTLLDLNAQFELHDPLAPRWQQTLDQLTDYPQDPKDGLLIGAGLPLAHSHRHWSHLIGAYPMMVLNADHPADRALIIRSLDHWTSMRTAWAGYSWLGATSLNAIMGRGDQASEFLHLFLEKGRTGTNTLYREAGPVIETPLQAAQSLQDMLLQSYGGAIRVLPAIPAAWADVSFHNLRAQGAFLVSAVRRGGKTQFISITSLAGAPCRVKTDLAAPLLDGKPLECGADGMLTVPVTKGQTVLLSAPGVTTFTMEPTHD